MSTQIFIKFLSLIIVLLLPINLNAKEADINAVIKGTSLTPLQYCAIYGKYEIADKLIKKGANLDIKNQEDGKTALMYALGISTNPKIQENKNKIANLLIKKGANLDIKDNLGATALHWALATFPKIDLVKLLLKKGANVNATDNDGVTPLSMAISSKNRQLIELLKSNGAKLTTLNKANLAFQSNQYKKAFNLYNKACNSHQGLGCAGVANIYKNGIGKINIDMDKAITFYEKACNYGDGMSCSVLGLIYYQGKYNIKPNIYKARTLLKKGCDSGHMTGCQAYKMLLKEK